MTNTSQGGARTRAVSFSLFALAVACTAHAGERTPVLAPIVVTPTRFPEPADTAPIGTRVITRNDIANAAARTLAELLGELGGITVRNAFGGPDLSIDLRGMGITGDQNTLVLLDGVRLNEEDLSTTRLSTIPIDAIERIEILPGGGAVQFGGGATGGTINIITRSPLAAAPGGNASLTLGSHALRDARGSLNAGSGPWGFNLHVQRRESDNYRDNNRSEQNMVNGEWRYVGDAGHLALRFGADEQRARLPGPRTEAQLKSDPRGTATPLDHANSRSEQLGLYGEQRAGAFVLAADISHRVKKAGDFYDYGVVGNSRSNATVRTTSLSPRLNWDATLAGMPNRLTAGMDWSGWDFGKDTEATFFGFPSNRDESGRQTNRALYLRDELGLTATHFGCGSNQCGSCHVMIDGHAVASCDTPLWAATGKSVVTLEGLGTPERPHPLQTAFIGEQALQCGYCISGVLMTAAALLKQNPKPTEAQVRAALDRNLCRCGSHNRIVRAILRASKEMVAA